MKPNEETKDNNQVISKIKREKELIVEGNQSCVEENEDTGEKITKKMKL